MRAPQGGTRTLIPSWRVSRCPHDLVKKLKQRYPVLLFDGALAWDGLLRPEPHTQFVHH